MLVEKVHQSHACIKPQSSFTTTGLSLLPHKHHVHSRPKRLRTPQPLPWALCPWPLPHVQCLSEQDEPRD